MKQNHPKFETAIKEITLAGCQSQEMTTEIVDQTVEDVGTEFTAPFLHCHWSGLGCTVFSYN